MVVNNRNRMTDDGRGPADHVVSEITAAGGEAVADYSDAADPGSGAAMVVAAAERWGRLDICVANAASEGGLLAFGRSLAAEGEARGVLTNLLLPYALTQMTDDGMPSAARRAMDPDLVAPVLTALASPRCRLSGEYIVTGGDRLRRASAVEWGTVMMPNDPGLSPESLQALLAESGRGKPKEFRVSVDALTDLVAGDLG